MHIKHKNTLFLVLGIILAIVLSKNQVLMSLVPSWGYMGAIVAGAMFTSTFTVSVAGLILVVLAKTIPIVPLILFGVTGALIADWLIFTLFRDKIEEEMEEVFGKINGNHLYKMLHTRYFAWTLPVIGAMVIMSPLPDELGIGLMGISKMNTTKFLAISLVSHLVGMTTMIGFGKI